MKKLLLIFCVMLQTASVIQAQEKNEKLSQENKQENVQIRVKGIGALNNPGPDIYVDGKKFDFDFDLLNPEKIESIEVIKGEKAIKEFNASNGVLLVKTKKPIKSNPTKITVRGTKSLISDGGPMIIIDGIEASDKDILNRISPDEIESIEIIKDEQAFGKYYAPNGAIIITTKKGSKKKE